MSVQVTLPPETVHAVITQYFAATRSNNKAEAMLACFAEDGVIYDPVGTTARQGHTQLRAFFQKIAALFTEVELCKDFTSINGNEAAVKWIGRAIGQNGQTVTFEGINLFELNAEGKIQSLKAYWNPEVMIVAGLQVTAEL